MPSRAAAIRFVFLAAVTAILAATPVWTGPIGVANAQTTTVAGATPGSLSVGATGKASYDIPIAVPPGIAGMVPNISLHYGSGADNGIAGMGWSLSGLPSIERCRRTPAQDGQCGGIEYNANDRFCLGGKRLVASSGTYGANGTEYRTEIDGFSRIISYGSQGTGPEWFRVWTKSGRIIDYVATPDSRVEAAIYVPGRQYGGGPPRPGEVVVSDEVRRWAIDRVADSTGNYMTVSYFEDSAIGAHRPVRVDYSFNDAAGVTAQSSVRFSYETRTDVTQGYPDSAFTTTDMRLQAVQTWTDGALVRDYGLAYEYGGATGRSRLTGVTECDANGNCLAPHVFGWKPENSGFSNSIAYDTMQFLNEGEYVDLNGDGLTDFIAAHNTPYASTQQAFLNTGTGWQESPAFQPPFFLTGENTSRPGVQIKGAFVDLNADGLVDFAGGGETWYNTGSGWQEVPGRMKSFALHGYYIKQDCNDDICDDEYWSVTKGDYIDVNGDGRTDFVRAYNKEGSISQATYLNTASGWQVSTEYTPPFVKWKIDDYSRNGRAVGSYVDVNGDGLLDYVGGSTVWLNTGSGWQENSAFGGALSLVSTGKDTWNCDFEEDPDCFGYTNIHGDIADINGDGLVDYVWASGTASSSSKTVYLNTGKGWIESPELAPPFIIFSQNSLNHKSRREGRFADVNGDGLADFYGDKTWLNTGAGWLEDPSYGAPPTQGSGNNRSGNHVDINGDGLADTGPCGSVMNRRLHRPPARTP